MLTLRTLRPVRRATPARAVAAVMAAHANQHGAETPSRPSLARTCVLRTQAPVYGGGPCTRSSRRTAHARQRRKRSIDRPTERPTRRVDTSDACFALPMLCMPRDAFTEIIQTSINSRPVEGCPPFFFAELSEKLR